MASSGYCGARERVDERNKRMICGRDAAVARGRWAERPDGRMVYVWGGGGGTNTLPIPIRDVSTEVMHSALASIASLSALARATDSAPAAAAKRPASEVESDGGGDGGGTKRPAMVEESVAEDYDPAFPEARALGTPDAVAAEWTCDAGDGMRARAWYPEVAYVPRRKGV